MSPDPMFPDPPWPDRLGRLPQPPTTLPAFLRSGQLPRSPVAPTGAKPLQGPTLDDIASFLIPPIDYSDPESIKAGLASGMAGMVGGGMGRLTLNHIKANGQAAQTAQAAMDEYRGIREALETGRISKSQGDRLIRRVGILTERWMRQAMRSATEGAPESR